MDENSIARIVVDAAFSIHQSLGPGLLESVYEILLAEELASRGQRIERQRSIPIEWKGRKFEEGFRADLVVEGKVIIELKSAEQMPPVAPKQVLTYLRLMDLRLGLLINFGAPLIKDGIRRIANRMPD